MGRLALFHFPGLGASVLFRDGVDYPWVSRKDRNDASRLDLDSVVDVALAADFFHDPLGLRKLAEIDALRIALCLVFLIKPVEMRLCFVWI